MKTIIRTEECRLPEWSLPALINGDYSALSDDEIDLLDNFNGYTSYSPIGDAFFAHSNDLQALGGMCYNTICTVRTEIWDVISIDALYDEGWYENDSMKIGKVALPPDPTDLEIIQGLKKSGWLSKYASRGNIRVEWLDEELYYIYGKFNDCPLFKLIKL